jgi:putative FmdB family regulatory protein
MRRCSMPLYDFVCEDCKEKFTKTMHFDELEKSEVKCPHCGSTKVHREVAAFFAATSKKS